MNILIISHSFPPLNSIASHRPYGWAKAWMKMGHTVHVLTTKKYPLDGLMTLQFDLDGIKLHKVGYLPIRELQNTEVASNSTAVLRNKKWEKFKLLTRRSRIGLGMFGEYATISFPFLLTAAKRIVSQNNINVVVTTSTPEVVHFIGNALAKEDSLLWVADYRDLWFPDMGIYKLKIVSLLTGLIHKRILKNADLVTTVSEGLAERLSAYINKSVVVTYNGYHSNDQGKCNTTYSWDNSVINIVYTGRMYPKKRDPELLFAGLALLRSISAEQYNNIKVHFFGPIDPSTEKAIREYELHNVVILHGPVTYDESLKAQRSADILLFLDWMDEKAEGVITGKLFEYLVSRKPILSIGNRTTTEAMKIIRTCGCGVSLTTADEIASYFSSAREHGEYFKPDHEKINRFSRERQAALLMQKIESNIN